MIAKPAVDPRARCALMMPEAMPERSGGIEDIASLVVGAIESAAPAPTSTEPEHDDHERSADAGQHDHDQAGRSAG